MTNTINSNVNSKHYENLIVTTSPGSSSSSSSSIGSNNEIATGLGGDAAVTAPSATASITVALNNGSPVLSVATAAESPVTPSSMVATMKKVRPKTASPTRHGPQQCQVRPMLFPSTFVCLFTWGYGLCSHLPHKTHTSTHPLGEQDFPNDKGDADKERSTTTVCTLSESQAIQFRGIVACHARGSTPDCWHSPQRVTMMECGNLISHSSHKGPGDRSMFGFYGQSLTEWKSLFFGEARQMRWNFKIQVQRSLARPTYLPNGPL